MHEFNGASMIYCQIYLNKFW